MSLKISTLFRLHYTTVTSGQSPFKMEAASTSGIGINQDVQLQNIASEKQPADGKQPTDEKHPANKKQPPNKNQSANRMKSANGNQNAVENGA